jgi:hypothetical protein
MRDRHCVITRRQRGSCTNLYVGVSYSACDARGLVQGRSRRMPGLESNLWLMRPAPQPRGSLVALPRAQLQCNPQRKV